MLKLTKKTEYALMALRYMAQSQGQVSVREICTHCQIPFDTTSKVLQLMNAHGFVRSTQGIRGGYEMTKSPADISIKELIELIEGEQHLACMSESQNCQQRATCNIVTPMHLLIGRVNTYLQDLSLKELFDHKGEIS